MERSNTPRPENPPARDRRRPRKAAEPSEREGIEDQDVARNADNRSDLDLGGDTGFDRVVGPDEAGLGGGLDQAEEAQLGVTDEELAEKAKRVRTPNE